MSRKFVRSNYKQFENFSDQSSQGCANGDLVQRSNESFGREKDGRSIKEKIHDAINSLRVHGWLDIEEFRLPSRFIDTRALFFKLDELFEREPVCISDQKEVVAMGQHELRPLLEEAISSWGPPSVKIDSIE